MTIEQLATASGLPVATLETLERDETQASRRRLLAVKQALETGSVLSSSPADQRRGGPGVAVWARTGGDGEFVLRT